MLYCGPGYWDRVVLWPRLLGQCCTVAQGTVATGHVILWPCYTVTQGTGAVLWQCYTVTQGTGAVLLPRVLGQCCIVAQGTGAVLWPCLPVFYKAVW